jgi:hypothetical protein
MRIIHIRFSDRKSFSTRIVKESGLGKQIITNVVGGQIVLVRPQLKRKIVSGVFIVDHWGSYEKWFTDTGSKTTAMWGVRDEKSLSEVERRR